MRPATPPLPVSLVSWRRWRQRPLRSPGRPQSAARLLPRRRPPAKREREVEERRSAFPRTLRGILERFGKSSADSVTCPTRFELCQIFSIHLNRIEKVTGLTNCLIRIKMDQSELPLVRSVTSTHICIPVSAPKPIPELVIGANTDTRIGYRRQYQNQYWLLAASIGLRHRYRG